MAKKPCNYKFNGQTYSETDFKKMLSDGLLDKFVLDDNASIPSVFGKNKVNPNETAAQKFRAPVTEAKQTYSDVQKVTEDSYYDNVSNNLIEKDGKNWNVKNEVTGEVYHTAKSLKDATNWQETENQIIGRSVESKASEVTPTPVAETKAELIDVDSKLQKEQIEAFRLSDRGWRHWPKMKKFSQRIKNALYKNGYDAALAEGEAIKQEIEEGGKLKLKSKNPAIEILNALDRYEGSFEKNNLSKEFKEIMPQLESNKISIDDIPDSFFESSSLVGKKSASTEFDSSTGDEIIKAGDLITAEKIKKLIASGANNINTLKTEGKTDAEIRAAGFEKISKENNLFLPEKKQQPAPTTETKAEPTTKTEPKPTTEKVERKGPVEVEAETKRGVKVTYKAEILPNGKVTVQSTAEAPFGGQAENPKISNLEIRTDSRGNRYVETPKSETRVYIDKVKEAPKAKEAPVKEEVTGKGQPTKVKIYAREPKLDDRGMPELTKFSREIEFTKNKRAKADEIAWETTVNGKKVKATPEEVVRIEKALAEQQKKETKPAQEKRKRAEENLKAMQEQAEGIDEKEVAQGEDAEWAAEAAAEDTRPKEKTTKRGDKKSFLASQARGNSTKLLQELLERFGKLFPNIAIVNDENAFNQKAYQLGRNPQSAAIFSDGVIYLNPLVANNNTAFEEYSHVYLSVLEQVNKPLYNKLIEETKKNGKEYMDEVLNDPAYSDIHDNANAVAFEAASKMVADRAEKIFDSARKNPLLDTIKRIWKNIADWFKVKSKLDINRDNLDDIIQRVAREINGNMSISSISSKDLSNIQNTNIRTAVKVNTNSIINQSSERAKWFRENFLPYKGLREDTAQALTKGRNDIAVFEQRSKAVIEDFNKGISEYNKENGIESNEDKVTLLQKVNQALQDPVFRANWFAVDENAEELIKPHVETMRGMIDDLQKQLVDSGLLTDDLEVSITGNMDMYVNTAYYAFSGLNEGNWLDLFTPQEQDQILDYVHETKYTPARELTYTIDNNGKVTAKFTNAYGVESESEIKVDSIDALKQFLSTTRRVGRYMNLLVDKLPFNTSVNKQHTIPFEFGGLDISSLGNEYGFKPNDNILRDAINSIGKANQDLNKISDLIHGRSKLTGKQAAGATKKKKNLKDIHKLLLKEIKDPATNFMRTIAKQSNLLFSGQVEQAIIDSKYMANYGEQVGQLTKQVNNPASRLNGYYVTPEMHDFLMGKSAKSFIEIARSGARALAGKSTDTTLSLRGADFFNTMSGIAKAYVTIFSIGSNAANYFSGYLQLAKTGNLPIGMISAMRSLEKTFEKIGTSKITKEDVAASFLNTVPTIIRGITKIAGQQGFLKDGISPLTEDQKRFYGVSDYSQLSADQKAKVLLEELMAEGVINNNIDANVIQELTAAAFDKEAIPDELVKSSYEKIKNRVKGFGQSTMEAASSSYSFSDSMFKAVFYMNEKKKNWDTYGSVMLQKGASMEEVERAMKDRTAMAVKQQMPTYDRSPEFLKALSKFPLIGSFVQFDFQSKVNDKNIAVDIYNMVKDSIGMHQQGYSKEGNILAARAFAKSAGLGLSSAFSYAMYKLIGSIFSNYDDDDDETLSTLLPDYRKNNQVIHLDSNKKGVHEYIDISRIDPQSAYYKYFKAFQKGGFDEGVEEILKPYISPDIFAGAFAETYAGLDKYGNVSKEIEGMNWAEKMKYLAEERIMPSGTIGQIMKIIDGINQREVNEVPMSAWNELSNAYLGVKIRKVNIDKEIGNKLNYDHLKKISNEVQVPLKTAIEDYNTKLDQFKRGKGGITQSELNDAKLEVELQNKEATEKANEIIGRARYMVDKYKKLGYNDDEIRKSLDDANTPQYLINLLMSGNQAVFDDEGNVIKGTFRRFKKRKSDLNLDLNLNLNLKME